MSTAGSPLPFRRIAIVNRGEAALRCLRTVKTLRRREGSDLRAIALYTEVDRDAPFVRHADEAFALEARATPVASYLDHDLLLDTLLRARAEAVWPGWGFVSEDPVFVERVTAAGIRFLGPSAETMRSLGDKIAAKSLAEGARVPVTPWSGGVVADEESAARHAERIGYPVMIKASAGGGGRGIRAVETPGELAAAFRSAASEATSAFGDGRLFLERRVHGGRHVEVQIAGDEDGHVLALGCRDCSVQRRHQKVIEETPPPGLAPAVLEAVREAALRIARAVGYRGLGTVEFLVAPDGFAFLEVNPRLQVEHGITEALTGLDLVELQIRIARGECLGDLAIEERGAAIEARVCAEDPAAGFLPSPGRVARFDPALGPCVRIDSGVVAGSTIPAAFDSLIAKVIASASSREEARARLVGALQDFDLVIEGGATNKGYLIDLLDSRPFRAGGVDTGWLDREPPATPADTLDADGSDGLVAAAILAYQRSRDAARRRFYADTTHVVTSRIPPSVGQQIELSWGGATYRLTVCAVGAWRYRVHLDGRSVRATLASTDEHVAQLAVGRRTRRILHDWSESSLRLEVDGRALRFGTQSPGQVRAETPALLVALQVATGDEVVAGQTLGVLEAMKMEIAFRAPTSGVVREVRVRPGQQVAAGDLLLVLAPREDAADDEAAARLALAAEDGEDKVDLPEEIGRILLGYDVDEERAGELARLLDAPAAPTPSREHRAEVDALRKAILLFADVEELFARAPRASRAGEIQPSNDARLRTFVRRLHAGGAGIDPTFLERIRAALSHYGVSDLTDVEPLERAVLRLLACQHAAELRHRLVLGAVRRLQSLAVPAGRVRLDRELAEALSRIAAMRGLVSDRLADAALETRHALFDAPRLERRLARSGSRDHGEPADWAGLDRLERFALEPIPVGDGLLCYHARSRELPGDERIFVFGEVLGARDRRGRMTAAHLAAFEIAFHRATRALRSILAERDPEHRLQWNRITLTVRPPLVLDAGVADELARRLAPATRRLGLEKVVVRLALLDRNEPARPPRPVEAVIADVTGQQMDVSLRPPRTAPLEPASAYERKVADARRRRLVYPYEILRLEGGELEEFDLEPDPRSARGFRAVSVAGRPHGRNESAIVFGLVRTPTDKIPEGMERVLVLSDPTRGMGALAAPECDRIVAAIDLAEERGLPLEWIPVSSGARIAMDSGTENLDATARVVRRIVEFTGRGGTIHVIVHGVNVGAQSYWNALATMLPGTRGALVMTPGGSMVLTGRAALEASGAVSAEDEIAIGGFERIAGPNGEAQYYASDLPAAYRVLHDHYRYTYVVPGEAGPRRQPTEDPRERDVTSFSYADGGAEGFRSVGEIFADASNPGRKRPFAMRAVMAAVIDRDGGWLERWSTWAGAETAIVWDAHLGGFPVCLIGIESRSVPRQGYRPFDGPADWTGGTLFPLSSRKIARALTAASGNRPVVMLANLSGFDGSPESMRRLQLEHGAEIARAVVGFQGPLLFLVVSRYHGGAYVVFSQSLNPRLRAAAFAGAHASVIGGSAAAKVVFAREVRTRTAADPRVRDLRAELERNPSPAARDTLERVTTEVALEVQSAIASEFDAVHSVERAREVGSLRDIVPPSRMRPYLVAELERALGATDPERVRRDDGDGRLDEGISPRS